MSGLTSLSWSIGKRNAAPASETGEERRYSDHYVVFRDQFRLGTPQEVFPPGHYVVETAEESIERTGHTARVRTATALIVPTASGTRSVQVRADELQAALDADAGREHGDAQSENPDSGKAAVDASVTREAGSLQAQLECYGIERVPADVFIWGGHRYTRADDAIAAAKRAIRTSA